MHIIIVMPHRMHECKDAACSMVCLLVTTISCAKMLSHLICHLGVDLDRPKEPYIRWQPRSPQGKGLFLGRGTLLSIGRVSDELHKNS